MSRREQKETLEQRVLEFIRRNGLALSGQKVLVAVSGGPDSVCLLYALFRLQKELDITLHVAHLNHQLRGEEAAVDAHYVEELARKLNLPATIEKRDVPAYQARHHLTLEEAAREVRYSFLAQTAKTAGAERVAVGHTLNDQVETILLHIIRGTGTRGLRGLQPCNTMQFSGDLTSRTKPSTNDETLSLLKTPHLNPLPQGARQMKEQFLKNRLTVIRPLLEIKREETEEYCSQLQLAPCLDTSNLSLSMLRNRVRHELLPLLQSYNPGIFECVLRIGRIAEDEQAFLDTESDKAWRKLVRREQNAFILNKEQFQELAPALQRQLLRRAFQELLGTLKDIETRHIEEIMEALEKPAGRRITLPEGVTFGIEYSRYLLGFNPEEIEPFPELAGTFDIDVSGETRIPGWRIEALVAAREQRPGNPETGNSDGFLACFDKDKVGTKIKVRARQRGDCFQPLGMSQPKKVAEFMLDARIPRTWRNKIPIFLTPRQIIWVAGWRIDERVKVTPKTRQVLCLKMVRWLDERRGKSRRNSRSSQV